MAKMGRPRKLARDKRTDGFRVLLTPTERKRTKGAATAAGLDESAWARGVLLAAVDKLAHGGGPEPMEVLR